jgi:DNA repair photolyase
MAPIIPGLTDHEIPALLRAAREAGATSAGYVLLRLPYQIKALFLEWLERHFPDRAAHVESLIRQTRGGDLYRSQFFERQRGTGAHAHSIGQSFRLFSKRLGFNQHRPAMFQSSPPQPHTAARPTQQPTQLGLFD